MSRPKRILVYGFGPYRQFRENITARILRMIPAQRGLKKMVFPVRFQRRQFVGAIVRFQPDIVIGLGQSTRRRIEVESQAVNRRRVRANSASKKISAGSPARLETTLPLAIGRQARRSADAGDYVCNFSMYVMLDHIRRTGVDCRYAFIHIPYDREPEAAALWVEGILRSCRSQRSIIRRRDRRTKKAA